MPIYRKEINFMQHLFQVAPYERPALSKGFLLPEGMHSHHKYL